MRTSLLLIALLAFYSQAAGSSEPDPNGVVMVADDDAEMKAAIAHAQATLDEFLAVVRSPPKGATGFKLKVGLTDEHGTEHFWVDPFTQTKSGFEGTLANEPGIVKSVELGQTITFDRAQVSDWGYVLEGRQVGSFTVCVMLKHVTAEDAAFYRSSYGFDC